MVLVWWFVSAHKWFKGPKVNVDHLMLGREGNTVDGEAKDKGADSEGDLPELAPVGSTDKAVEVR